MPLLTTTTTTHFRRQGHRERLLAREHERDILGRLIVGRLADKEGVDLVISKQQAGSEWQLVSVRVHVGRALME